MGFRPVRCKYRCDAVASCVFYQYEADTCYLCIHDAADAAAEDQLTSSTAPAQAVRTHVKQDIADVIFTSTQSCHGPMLPPTATSQNYNQTSTSGPITRMRFCSTDHFNNVVAGFYATYGGVQQPRVGCALVHAGTVVYHDAYSEFQLADYEVVLHISACFSLIQGFTIVNTLTIVTNLRQIGPYGTDHGNCVSYSQSGYELVGIYGVAGWALDSIAPVLVAAQIHEQKAETSAKCITCHCHVPLSHVTVTCYFLVSLSRVAITCHYMLQSRGAVACHCRVFLSRVTVTCRCRSQ